MYANMRSDRFPILLDYEAALRKEAEIKPLRSKNEKRNGIKPLAERSRTWLTIRKVERLGGEYDVAIRLHSTDIIIYRPNGEIVIDQGGWDTATTHETIGRILGTTIWQKHKVAWIHVKNGCFPLQPKRRNLFLRERERDGEAGRLFYLNPEYPVIHKLRIKDYNAIKRQYSKFTSYAVNMTKLAGEIVFDEDELAKLGCINLNRHDIENKRMAAEWMRSDDFDSHSKALLYVYACCDRYVNYLMGSKTKNPEFEVLNSITNIIKRVHRDEVFEAIEVKDGRIVKDSNSEFFGD